MPIRLKQTTNTSDQFYPLNEEVLSEGNKVGFKDPNTKTTRSKLTPFVKNVLKSTKNLAFDVVDSYVPNLKEVKGSFKETVESAREDVKNEYGPLLAKAKSFVSGDRSGEDLKTKISKEKKEILQRLKSGKFYTSMEDEMEASFGGFDLDDFGSLGDFSTPSDSYQTVSEPDSLSDEPFGGVHKGRVKSINVSARNRQLNNKTTSMHPPARKSRGSSSSQLRLGDELVSNTTHSVGNNIIKKQDEVWARTYAADKQNFEKLYGYQNEILRGVNSIVEFNNNVMSSNVAAQMEYQGKMIAAQQDYLSSLKEIKDAMLIVSSHKPEEVTESLNSKILNNPIGLNGKAYWENIKKNFKDVAGSNPVLSSLMMTPMMGDMLSMSEDTGMKMINPLNMVSSGILKMFLSKNTKNRLMDFNELLSNFGGLFTGKMNMLARYGQGPAKTIGRLLGARDTSVSLIDNGLADPNEVVGWTSKSERTLNEVIPTLLSKQLAALSGKDELIYDYKDGKFKTSKSIKEEVKLRRDMAYENADTVRYTDAMASFISTNAKTQELAKRLGGSKEVSTYIKKISMNLIKTGQMWDPELAGFNDQYRNSLLEGIPDDLQDDALKAFSTAYDQMSAKETLRFNGAIRNVNMNLQKRMDAINADYKTYGGTQAVVESALQDQIEEKKRSLKYDLSMQLSDKEIEDAKNGRPSAHYIQVKNDRMRREMEIRKMESTLDNTPSNVKATVEGFGDINGSGTTGTGGVPNAIDKIFRLLTLGIPVYDQGPVLPDRLIKLKSQLNTLDKNAAKFKEDAEKADKDFQERMISERNQLYADQVRFKRNQKVMQNSFMSYILPGGNSAWQQTNIVNRGTNKLIDATSGAFGKLLGSGYGGGEGLLGDVSYEEIDRQNLENATNAFIKRRDKLLSQIEADKDNPKAKLKNKARQKIIDLMNKSIESNKKRLDAINNGKDNSEETKHSSEFNKALNDAISEFSNKYIMQTHAIDPNGPSMKDRFADVLAKGKEAVKDSDIFIKSEVLGKTFAERAKTAIADGAIPSATEKATNVARSISGYTTSAKTAIANGAIPSATGTVAAKTQTVANQAKSAIGGLDYRKVVEVVKSNNIKSADEFNEFAAKHPPFKKYTFFVSKLFSTGAVRSKNDEVVVTPRSNIIIDIFEKRDAATNVDPNSVSITGKTTPGNISTTTALVPNEPTVKAKTESKKESKKSKFDLKMIEVQTKGSSKSKEKDMYVDANGTIIDNSTGAEMNFREYKGLKTALVLNGYENAENMSNEDLYALVGAIKGPKGESLRATSDYRLLKRRIEAKARQEAEKEFSKKTSSNNTKKTRDSSEPLAIYYPLMVKNGTLRYKNLMQLLQPKVGQGIYNFSKEALFAMISALPTKTGDDENFKAVLTRTKEYKHLKSHFMMGFGDKVAAAFDVKRNIRRATAGIRLFKYRKLLRILDMMNLGEDDTFFRSKLDDKYALKATIEGLGSSKDKKLQNIYNAVIMTKDYMKLSRDTVTGATKKEIKEKRREIKFNWKQGNLLQRKYGNLISVLRLAGARGKNFNYSSLTEDALYNLAKQFGMQKDPTTGKMLHASILEMAEFKELQRKYEGKKFDINKFGTAAKEFMDDLKEGSASKSDVSNTTPLSEILKFVKVVAMNSWYNLTGKIKDFASAAANGFKSVTNINSDRPEDSTNSFKEMSEWAKRTKSSVDNLGATFTAFFTGDQDRINRARLLGSSNLIGYNNPDFSKDRDLSVNDDNLSNLKSANIIPAANGSKNKRNNGKYSYRNKKLLSSRKRDIIAAKKIRKNKIVPNNDILKSTTSLVPVKNSDLNRLKAKPSSERAIKGELRKNALVIAGQNGAENALLYSSLAQAEMLASVLKVMGFRDDGKLNEKDHETVAGYLQGIEDKTGGESGDGNGVDSKWYDKLFNFAKGMGGKNLLKGGMLTLAAAGLVKRGVTAIKDKNHTGLEKMGYLTGLDDDMVDQSKWFNVERGGNVKNVTKYGIMSGGTLFKGIGSAFKKGIANAKAGPATVTNAIGKVKEAPKKAWEIVKEGLEKFLKDPKVLKRLGPELGKKIKQLPSMIVSKFKNLKTAATGGVRGMTNSFKQGIKAIPVAGWAIAIGDAVWSFASGMNDAPKYFTVSPNDTTTGMRITAGIVKMLKSIIQSILSITGVGAAIAIGLDIIIPDDWLVNTVYKLVASEADETELKMKQQEEEARAKALGTDAKTLAKAENNSLLSKMGSGIHAAFSKKTYKEIQAEKTAKKLGMSVEDYNSKNTAFEEERTGKFNEKYPEFAKLSSPKDAITAFSDKKLHKKLEKEAEYMFVHGDTDAIHKVYKAINDKKLGNQDTDTGALNSGFRGKLEKLFKDPEVANMHLSINEAKRNPFTQFAYYSKGRAPDNIADQVLKLAGFAGGLNFWNGDNSINTKTLSSRHLAGNAVDFKVDNLSQEQLASLGKIANKHGINWGGDWTGFKDPPHFEDKNAPQLLATGGIVNARGVSTPHNHLLDTGDKVKTRLNPGEMVLTKSQQTALFNKLKRFEYETVVKGSSAKNPVTLNESPLATNDKDTLVILNQALEIQNKIYQEQTRHNKVSENFFEAIIKLVAAVASNGGGNNYTEKIDQLTSALTKGSYDIASGY